MAPSGSEAAPSIPEVMTNTCRRRLVVNADDFGRSDSINQAVIQAHQRGILTTASLMVNEPGFDEAVRLARQHPSLGVGLHLTFLCGRSALAPADVPSLVDSEGNFSENPVAVGMKYFFARGVRQQLRSEMVAQFQKFHATGLRLDHVNGHLHLHLHPAILPILLQVGPRFGMKHVRLTRDPLQLNLSLAKGRLGYRLSHAFIFSLLAGSAAHKLKRGGFVHTDHVFGLLQNAEVNVAYVRALLPRLPAGDSELYSHPSLHEFRHEFEAMADPAARAMAQELQIALTRYQDL